MKLAATLLTAIAFAGSACVKFRADSKVEPLSTSPSGDRAWIDDSNKLAKDFTIALSTFNPYLASLIGYTEFDDKAPAIATDVPKREKQILVSWKVKLETLANNQSLPKELQMDIAILLDSVKLALEEQELHEKYNIITFNKVAESVYTLIFQLLNDQSSHARQNAALERFDKIVNGFERYKPLSDASIEFFNYEVANARGKILYPKRLQVEKYLKQSSELVKGVKELFVNSKLRGWEKNFEKFDKQVQEYDFFVKKDILPNARTEIGDPKEIYVFNLKQFGVFDSPEQLIIRAEKDFKFEFSRFEKVAEIVARRHGFDFKKPDQVIKALAQKNKINSSDILELYHKADVILENIIRDHQLVTLPKKPLMIRLASEAETAVEPVPHLDLPPLVNNSGERPQFILPYSKGEELDPNLLFLGGAVALTAHEGRPGHDLQFSSMLDNGVSLIRSIYAFNSANVEGWGLYAEDLVFPYISPEAQLMSLQMRLLRISRMFLDPKINLKLIGHEQVSRVHQSIGLSEGESQSEYERYAFRLPGQATSYYYGMLKLLDMKSESKSYNGKNFKLKCFNDTVLAAGLVPLAKIRPRVVENLHCIKGY